MRVSPVTTHAPQFGWGWRRGQQSQDGFRSTLGQMETQHEKGVSFILPPAVKGYVSYLPPRDGWFRFHEQADDRAYRWAVRYEKGLAYYTLSAYPADAMPQEPKTKEPSGKIYTEEEKRKFLDDVLADLEALADSPASSDVLAGNARPEKKETPFLWRLEVTKKNFDYDASKYVVRWTDAQGRVKEAKLQETKRKAEKLVTKLEDDLTMQFAVSQIMGIVGRVSETCKRITNGEFPNLTDPDWVPPAED